MAEPHDQLFQPCRFQCQLTLVQGPAEIDFQPRVQHDRGEVPLRAAEAVAQHLWVAPKHEITYRKSTFLSDIVVAEVIAEKVEGARAMFTTGLRRGEEVLSEIKSSWCCLDAVTQRPARLARDVISRSSVSIAPLCRHI